MATVQQAHLKTIFQPKRGKSVTLLHAENTMVPTNGRIVRKIGETRTAPLPTTFMRLQIHPPLEAGAAKAK
jgi:hypothetical protein